MTENHAAPRNDEPGSDLPSGLGKPAQRALAGAGYSRLEQFTTTSETEILKLYGMGPKAQAKEFLASDALPIAREMIAILTTKGKE